MITLDAYSRPILANIYRPKEAANETPIVLANGWTAGNLVMRRLAIWLAYAEQRTAVTFDHHRFALPFEHPEQHRAETLAAVVDSVLERTNTDHVEILGHSNAGSYGSDYVRHQAEAKSNKVSKLTLLAPVGVTPLSAHELVQRGAREIIALWHPRQFRHLGRLAVAAAAVGEYVGKNLPLSVAEVHAIADARSTPSLRAIRKAGIPVGVIGCAYDQLIPAHELERDLPPEIPFTTLKANHIDALHDREVRADVIRFHDTLTIPKTA